MHEGHAGPAFDVDVDKEGIVWIAAWNGIFKSTSDGLNNIKEIKVQFHCHKTSIFLLFL